ncbi:MAG: TolC family protein [Spirochaetaceae bacterium]|nr:TolC family protein [Spirochaetaceae bacterium]
MRELMSAASEASRDYPMFGIDLELAGLKKGKADIEAKAELDRLNAESTYQSALAEYRSSTLGFYNEVIDAVYSAASAQLDAGIAELKLANAAEDEKYAALLFESGSSSEVELKEAQIARKTAATDLKLAERSLKAAAEAVSSTAGIAWKSELVPAVPDFSPKTEVEAWLGKDTALSKARLAEKISALKTAGLAANAPKYDRRIQETELLKAKAAVIGAEEAGRQAFENALKNLENQAAMMQIRLEECDLSETSYQDSLKQLESGLISASDVNLKSIAVLNARKNLLQARKSYIKTVGSFKSAMGEDPAGL